MWLEAEPKVSTWITPKSLITDGPKADASIFQPQNIITLYNLLCCFLFGPLADQFSKQCIYKIL